MSKGFKMAKDINTSSKDMHATPNMNTPSRDMHAASNMNIPSRNMHVPSDEKTIPFKEKTSSTYNTSAKKSATKYIILFVSMIVLIIGGIVSFKIYQHSDLYLHKLLNNGNVPKVIEMYRTNLNMGQPELFDDKIYSYMNEMIVAFNNGECSYNDVIRKCETINRIIEQSDNETLNLSDYMTIIEELKNSKEAYQQGVAYIGTDNKKAIDMLEQVYDMDTNYSDAQTKLAKAKEDYHTQIISDADKKAAENDFNGALKILKEAGAYFVNDNTIAEKIAEIENAVVNNAVLNAEQDFNTEGYNQAIAEIENAKNIVGDNAQLDEQIDKYSEYIPVSIYDMEPMEYSSYPTIKRIETSYDNIGNKHKNILYAYHRSAGDENQYEVYPLMGKYDTLSFEVYRNNDEYAKTTNGSSEINIYGDNVLLKSITVDKEFLPQTCTVDITGVQKLKIEFGSDGKDASYWTNRLPGEIANVQVFKST